jgi:hypothetical protein
MEDCSVYITRTPRAVKLNNIWMARAHLSDFGFNGRRVELAEMLHISQCAPAIPGKPNERMIKNR